MLRTLEQGRGRFTVLALCFWLWSAASLTAQSATKPGTSTTRAVRILSTPNGRIVLQDDGTPVQLPADALAAAGPAAGAPDPAADEAAANQLKAQRLQRFMKLKFDRRPSAMLTAWAAPEVESFEERVKELREKEAEAKAKAEAAKPKPAVAATPAAPPPSKPAGWLGMTDAQIAQAKAAEAAKKAAEVQAEAQKKAAEEAAKKAEEQKVANWKMAWEFEVFARDVVLGRWDRVAKFFEQFDEKQAEQTYQHLLRGLVNPPRKNQNRSVPANLLEQPHFTFDDVLGIAAAAPGKGLTKKQMPMVAPIVRLVLGRGHSIDSLVELMKSTVAAPEEEQVFNRRQVALLFASLNYLVEMEPFLPTREAAVEKDDREGLNLLARHLVAKFGKEKRATFLEEAWRTTLAALATGEVEKEDKTEALQRAVELAPKVTEELGDAWMRESFTERPERGRELLATLGGLASTGFEKRMSDAAGRLRSLKLQTTAVEALLEQAPERAGEWNESLQLLAATWLKESLHAYQYAQTDNNQSYMQRDMYGNVYYSGRSYSWQRTPVTPIQPWELLAIRPSTAWLEMLDAGLQPKYSRTVAQLYLKLEEEENAFPYIERLAKTNPGEAQDLAEEFVRVWTKNHDPNSAQNRTNNYMFMYGFERRAAGIPLTRSKQERNLRELAMWAAKLRELPLEDLDESLLLRAFTSSHSAAEVYKLEAIEEVFGSVAEMKPETLATLAQGMRTNLAGIWRRPDVQKNAKTRRRQKDILLEVTRGYEVAGRVLARARQRHADDWTLMVAEASLAHDLNDFIAEAKADSGFTERRRAALDEFRAAAEQYAKEAADLPQDKWTTDPFDTWFYAALGAADLRGIDEKRVGVPGEPGKIREVLESMPEDVAKEHIGRFANNLFTRMSAVNPAVKFRYLESGFEIVGDDKRAHEARQVLEYYNDLVTEIELVATVDGNATVGTEPFGVAIDLLHTVAVERESGGFGKYLQNQNAVNFAYNYGRPTEDYRDKFQEAATRALSEQFEVMSVTFNTADVNSKSVARPGWRKTPYAYLLLKARGPEVDKLPPVQLDLDFLDTSGHVVLPVATAVVPLDASREPKGARPFEELVITQTLDERESKSGKLSVEVKAMATGLVPNLDDVLDFAPEDFEVQNIDDGGVSVVKFGDDQESILSERIWTLNLEGRKDLKELPTKFAFGESKVDTKEETYMRYSDADMVPAGRVVSLEATYGETRSTWPYWVAGSVLLIALVLAGVWMSRPSPTAAGPQSLAVPDDLTPFTVLGLLRHIQTRNNFDSSVHGELSSTIVRIEAYYFGAPDGDEPDLAGIAREWVGRAG